MSIEDLLNKDEISVQHIRDFLEVTTDVHDRERLEGILYDIPEDTVMLRSRYLAASYLEDQIRDELDCFIDERNWLNYVISYIDFNQLTNDILASDYDWVLIDDNFYICYDY